MQDDLSGLWPVSSIISECKAQARQNLDPAFTRFMNAAATALETLTRARNEARAEVERLNDTLRPYVEAVHREHDGHVSEINTLRTQLTATQARLNEAVGALDAAQQQFEFYAKEHDAKAKAAEQAYDDARYWGNVAEQNATKAEWQKRTQQAQTNHDFAAKMSGALRLAQQEGQSDA